jgi:hypothetical protein
MLFSNSLSSWPVNAEIQSVLSGASFEAIPRPRVHPHHGDYSRHKALTYAPDLAKTNIMIGPEVAKEANFVRVRPRPIEIQPVNCRWRYNRFRLSHLVTSSRDIFLSHPAFQDWVLVWLIINSLLHFTRALSSSPPSSYLGSIRTAGDSNWYARV